MGKKGAEIKRRNTYQRQIILNILKTTETHPTADWIYERARKHIPNLSLGTVYRNLKVLKEEGEILELNDGKVTRYDGRTDKHFHFKCINCGNIYDIEEKDIKVNLNIENNKLKPLFYEIFIYGLCHNCK